jgi:hypothetical protein
VTGEKLLEQDMKDIWALLSTREGARFFSRLLDLCGLYRMSYEPGDTHLTAFREGQRNIGNIVFDDLIQFEDAVPVLKRGRKEREANDEDPI